MLHSLELLSIALRGTLTYVLMNSVGHISSSAVRGQSRSRFTRISIIKQHFQFMLLAAVYELTSVYHLVDQIQIVSQTVQIACFQ